MYMYISYKRKAIKSKRRRYFLVEKKKEIRKEAK